LRKGNFKIAKAPPSKPKQTKYLKWFPSKCRMDVSSQISPLRKRLSVNFRLENIQFLFIIYHNKAL
jgi:hypothetical protein